MLSDSVSLFTSGGSLAKVAYMSEVRTIRKRHYSFSSLTSLAKSEDEDQEKGVLLSYICKLFVNNFVIPVSLYIWQKTGINHIIW